MAAHALKAASPIQTPSGDKARKSVTYAEVLPFLAELAVEAVERADAKLGLPRGGR